MGFLAGRTSGFALRHAPVTDFRAISPRFAPECCRPTWRWRPGAHLGPAQERDAGPVVTGLAAGAKALDRAHPWHDERGAPGGEPGRRVDLVQRPRAAVTQYRRGGDPHPGRRLPPAVMAMSGVEAPPGGEALAPARAAVPPDVPGTSTSAVTACKQQYGSPRAYAKQVRAVMQQAMTQRCVLPRRRPGGNTSRGGGHSGSLALGQTGSSRSSPPHALGARCRRSRQSAPARPGGWPISGLGGNDRSWPDRDLAVLVDNGQSSTRRARRLDASRASNWRR